MRALKFVAIPILFNLIGILALYSMYGGKGMADYGVGTAAGLVLSGAWLVQVKVSEGVRPQIFVNIVLLGFLFKMILVVACFFIAHIFIVEDSTVFSISLIVYIFFMLIGEVLFYFSKSWKEINRSQ